MKFLSIGAGAIGTYIGGSLELAGHQVVFLEQPDIANLLTSNGIRLELQTGKHLIENPQMADSMDAALSLGPYDAGIFALKSFDTHTALSAFKIYADKLPPFLCLQNGVENEAAIMSAFGEDKVIYGSVTSAIGRRGPGDIFLERLRGVGIAEGHPLSDLVVKAFQDANLNAVLYPKPLDMKWSKMITNLLANASSAILDLTPAEIFHHPKLFKLEILQLREALDVMKAQQIGVTNLPDTPVKALVGAIKYLPLSISRPLLHQAVGKGRGSKMPSFHIDLHHGRGKSEVEFLNGAVVRAGIQNKIPTPVNKFLNDTLLALTRGYLPLNEYQRNPDKLLEQVIFNLPS